MDPHLSAKGRVQSEEGLNGAACLLCTSLPIRFEARLDPSSEYLEGPMGPLLARSYPGVDWGPILVRYPSPPHPLAQGGLRYLILKLREYLVCIRCKITTEGPEGGAARFL